MEFIFILRLTAIPCWASADYFQCGQAPSVGMIQESRRTSVNHRTTVSGRSVCQAQHHHRAKTEKQWRVLGCYLTGCGQPIHCSIYLCRYFILFLLKVFCFWKPFVLIFRFLVIIANKNLYANYKYCINHKLFFNLEKASKNAQISHRSSQLLFCIRTFRMIRKLQATTEL